MAENELSLYTISFSAVVLMKSDIEEQDADRIFSYSNRYASLLPHEAHATTFAPLYHKGLAYQDAKPTPIGSSLTPIPTLSLDGGCLYI